MDGQQASERVPDQDVQPGIQPDNPFLKLRTRTLIPWVIIGTIIVFVLLSIADAVTQADLLDSATGDLVGQIGVYAAVAVWIAYACRNSGADLGRLIGRVPPGFNWFPAVGLLATALVFSIGSWYVTAYLLSRLVPGTMEWLMTLETPVADSVVSHALSTIIVIVIAPAVEEVLFRGILIGRWATKWRLRTAVVATALVFGILHVFNIVGATALGLITALLYLQTGTLIVPIAFHAANNLVPTLAEFAFGSDEPGTLAVELEEIEAMLLSGLVMMAVTLPVLLWYTWRQWPARDARPPYMDVA